MSSIEIDDIKIKYSPLNKELVVDGELLSIFIYEGDSSGRWVLEVVDECGTSTVWDYQFERGCKPEPPKFPSYQFNPSHKRVQVNHLTVTLKGIMPVQQNVPPGCRRYLGERRDGLGVTCRFALR
ncbi:hypothetical protein Sbal223_4491 (plasmid) [Shewanella baltica OS223]|nr:hypothetical protein Sbal223_4491 [Shewanella baltica OS223]